MTGILIYSSIGTSQDALENTFLPCWKELEGLRFAALESYAVKNNIFYGFSYRYYIFLPIFIGSQFDTCSHNVNSKQLCLSKLLTQDKWILFWMEPTQP